MSLGKGGGGSDPEPPDPGKVSAEQAKANIDAILASAAINRISENTPWGSVSYDITGYQPIGAPPGARAGPIGAAPPAPQSILPPPPDADQRRHYLNAIAGQRSPGPQGYDPRAAVETQFRGVNTDQLARISGVDPLSGQGASQGSIGGYQPTASEQRLMPAYERTISLSPEQQRQKAQQDRIAESLGAYGEQLTGYLPQDRFTVAGLPAAPTYNQAGLTDPARLNTAGLTDPSRFGLEGLPPGATVDEGYRQSVEDALYGRHAARLNPRYETERRELETMLANQGITAATNPAAYSEAVESFDRSRNDAYEQARLSSIAGGGSEMERLFGLTEAARGARLGERGMVTDYDEARRARELGERQLVTSADEARRARELMERGEAFRYGGAERDRALQERMLERTQPMNELAAVLQGSPAIGAPPVSGMSQYQIAPPDVQGLYGQQYAGNLASEQAARQRSSSLWGNLIGAGATLGAAKIYSDRDLKTDIKPVKGEGIVEALMNVPTSTWKYKGDEEQRIGPMAQDWAGQFGGDGKTIPMPQMFGLNMAAVQELGQRVKRLEGSA